MRKFFLLLAVVAAAGCRQAPELPAVLAPYKVDIQQGNVVTQEMIGKLKAGMTRAQVRFALGSPLVVDPFRTDRWDYVYLYQKQGQEAQRRRITIIFEDEKLARIEGDVVPADGLREPPAPAARPAVPPPPDTRPVTTATDKPSPVQPEAATGEKANLEKPQEEKAKDEKPQEEKAKEGRGFFGRMLERLGF